MWPLLACSVTGLALIADRTLEYLRTRMNYRRFIEALSDCVVEGRLSDAAALCERRRSPIAAAASAYLTGLELDDRSRAARVQREGGLALERVERRLRALSTIAHLATLLGLLGTVAGLVGAFHTIELAGGQVQPSDLASGIWEALLTTVFGLTIAIPCLAAYHGFESAADRMALRMSFVIGYLDEWLHRRTPQLEPADSASGTMAAAVGQD